MEAGIFLAVAVIKGAAKTPIRVVALFAKGYGHCLQRAPNG